MGGGEDEWRTKCRKGWMAKVKEGEPLAEACVTEVEEMKFESLEDWEWVAKEDPWTGELVQLQVSKEEAKRQRGDQPSPKISFSGEKERQECRRRERAQRARGIPQSMGSPWIPPQESGKATLHSKKEKGKWRKKSEEEQGWKCAKHPCCRTPCSVVSTVQVDIL